MSRPTSRVLVVGAGANGLGSAVRIQEHCPDVEVTIMAEKFSPDTTSDGSAGFWETFAVSDTDSNLTNETGKETYDHLMSLCQSPLASTVKVQQVSGYQYWDHVLESELPFKDIVDGYRPLTKEELSRMPGARDGRFFTTLTVDVSAYLSWLTKRFLSNGGTIVQRKLKSLEEVSTGWDVVVNCSGLGSYHLMNDDKMTPIRGQVFRVEAPWIKHFILFDREVPSYILPNVDSVVVGGCLQKGDWSCDVIDECGKDIWDRALKVMPSLEGARILKRWAGLRPGRDTMRLEKEVMTFNGVKDEARKKLNVVHNYGHGGAGITLHWGCARKTVEMVSQFLREMEPAQFSQGRGGDVNDKKNSCTRSKL